MCAFFEMRLPGDVLVVTVFHYSPSQAPEYVCGMWYTISTRTWSNSVSAVSAAALRFADSATKRIASTFVTAASPYA